MNSLAKEIQDALTQIQQSLGKGDLLTEEALQTLFLASLTEEVNDEQA